MINVQMKGTDKENIQKDRINLFELKNKNEIKEEMGDANAESASGQLKLTETEISYLLAACESQFQKLNSILSKNPFFIDMKNPLCDGFTALHFACKFGTTDVIRCLIGNYKADVNIISNSGRTPLHVAVQFKQEEVASLLLSQYGANKNIRDYSGRLAADLVDPEGMETMLSLVGPATRKSLPKPAKAQTPALTSIKKGLQSFSAAVSLDNVPKAFSIFRKASEFGGHHQSPTSHHQSPTSLTTLPKETAHSSPFLLHPPDLDKHSLMKSLSFLSNRSSVKRTNPIRGVHSAKEEAHQP